MGDMILFLRALHLSFLAYFLASGSCIFVWGLTMTESSLLTISSRASCWISAFMVRLLLYSFFSES